MIHTNMDNPFWVQIAVRSICCQSATMWLQAALEMGFVRVQCEGLAAGIVIVNLLVILSRDGFEAGSAMLIALCCQGDSVWRPFSCSCRGTALRWYPARVAICALPVIE
jgi:hypothetical protein